LQRQLDSLLEINLKIDVNLNINDAVNLCKIFAFLFLVKQRCYIVVNNISQEQVCNVLVFERSASILLQRCSGIWKESRSAPIIEPNDHCSDDLSIWNFSISRFETNSYSVSKLQKRFGTLTQLRAGYHSQCLTQSTITPSQLSRCPWLASRLSCRQG